MGFHDLEKRGGKSSDLIMASPLITTFTQDNFDAEALKSSTPVLVDFWAEW